MVRSDQRFVEYPVISLVPPLVRRLAPRMIRLAQPNMASNPCMSILVAIARTSSISFCGLSSSSPPLRQPISRTTAAASSASPSLGTPGTSSASTISVSSSTGSSCWSGSSSSGSLSRFSSTRRASMLSTAAAISTRPSIDRITSCHGFVPIVVRHTSAIGPLLITGISDRAKNTSRALIPLRRASTARLRIFGYRSSRNA